MLRHKTARKDVKNTMPWDPTQYHKFQAERSAPFFDLLALVEIRPNLRVVDLGCGTGELTRRLAVTLPGSDVTGLDSSFQMLEKAASHSGLGLRFEQGDQAQLTGEWDLIFSNAALHWSENHGVLIPRLYDRLKPGGQIAVQVPSNHNHISHQLYRETAAEEPFKTILNGFQRHAPVLSIDEYARLLFTCGAQEIVVFEKVYAHVLEDADAVVEWISGTALVPYFERLGEHKEKFVDALRVKMRVALPEMPVFYPFRRTFFSARKPD
jgi:trans-aconitate 2-methyltransferase